MVDKATDMALPKDFTPLADFMEEGKIPPKTFVNVIGIIKDYRRPAATQGKDWKCGFRLFDLSMQSEVNWDVELSSFRPEKDMIKMPDCHAGDIIAQTHRNGPLSLLTNYETAIHIYPATKIPKPPQPASCSFKPTEKDKARTPKPQVEQYVSWLYENIDKDRIPEDEVFEVRSKHSTNVKGKLCELKAVQHGAFHDLIVHVVKDSFDHGDKVTLYVSDYTENPGFYNYSYHDGSQAGGRDGDPYGYTSGKTGKARDAAEWGGPYGKRTMQITCYEPHATFIKSKVTCGTWVQLFNVQIKWGANGANLEGYLREDRNGYGHKLAISILDPQEDPENIHPYLKNALRRKRDNEKEIKALTKQLRSDMERKGKKRPAADQPEKPLSSKQRRALRRAQAEQDVKQSEDSMAPPLDLNPLVTCENLGRPTCSVSDILQPVMYQTTIQGAPLNVKLPFTVAQYRANVRVIDFHPPRLQDFASGRKRTEYDVLSDNSDSESDSDEEDAGTLDSFVGERHWEWRFALCLQEAAVAQDKKKRGGGNNTFWVVVDNLDAQLLTGLDACNLRADPDELFKLRDKMFILWGDLEEKKSKQLAESDQKKKQLAKKSRKNATERPPDSSDIETADEQSVKHYGVQVREPNEVKADAGDGKRWERVYGLFGTKICGI
ncbi:telomere-binding alpha subunit central domain-containing protein [Colletotrichum karsti]|uniref:Telomere-binding alpha subunit central domain-containing protein n=1 Tax=Colletotrichum karsti TaxID=1095194 RepID=A0A9P6LEQ4_9PEZI|nr:telomere-binding alpha subunit central domain-containing protein [Colletotrichum karsti]KAF9869477.1 telomere-binding alpha subunit central domain-containing protein [Colletotrichum karsti]